ncbi:hypothetical protein POM88_038584 [Heracleum sosnowskyi]|uniref:Uncharacterized protein n=1 Tax=Heracleum sosnowskyi TaxID=360622 RepID=A0AAD8HAN4_9APIA|nr:hypothetical protein POM88_038584 [Heracleum sosnowskyi]
MYMPILLGSPNNSLGLSTMRKTKSMTLFVESKMENGFHKGKIKKKQNKFVEECTKDIQVCTKELSGMIKADPRLCDLLGRDSLEIIVSLLRHEHKHSEKLQVLKAVCEEHPKLSCEQLKLVVQALMKLIESNFSRHIFSGCLGLALLCDGREEMIVEEKDFSGLLYEILLTTGSIVRWGDDDAIQAIIQDEGEEGSLHSLSMLLEEGDMYMVKHVCWIISNITARNYAVQDVHGAFCGLLLKLVKVVQTCTLPDVVKEALWAISNAMCCSFSNNKCGFCDFWWSNCNDKYWVRRLIPFLSDQLLVMVFLEAMVNIGVADYTWKGPDPQRRVGTHSFLFRVFESIQLDTEMFPFLEFRFRGCWEPRLILCYDSLRKEWYSKKV